MIYTEELPYANNEENVHHVARRSYITGVIVVLVLNILDVVSTYAALDVGASELNPIADWLIDTNLLLPVKLAVCGTVLLIALKLHEKHFVRRMASSMWWLAGVYSIIVFLNTLTYIQLIT